MEEAIKNSRLMESVARRAAILFHDHQRSIYNRTDHLFAWLMLCQWLAAIEAALWLTPRTWAGQYSQAHLHLWAAIVFGGAITLFPVLLVKFRSGQALTRHVIAVSQMLMSALLIHLTGGRIETHFHVFGSLAFLAFYRDWRVFIPATLVVAADHFLRGVYWPQSVFGTLAASPWRWTEHAGWVIFENVFLIRSCLQSVQEMKDNARQRAELEATNEIVEGKVLERVAELQASENALRASITEQKRLESQLQQSQKMEGIGRLAGGIAHDFNNLLTVILGYSDSILLKLGKNHPLRGKVSEIQAAGQRAASLTSQLLAFSRKQILLPRTLELNSVVSNISQMIHRLLGEDIEVALHLDPSTGQVQADVTQLEQVLLNLAVNARDAMPHGGQLIMETQNCEIDQRAAALQEVPPGQYVLLAVSDTGCGMDEATKARVFEPFFTTKSVGKGTGLGLSMVLGVVQQSGGTVTVYSEPGMGTTFRIYLPRFDTPAAHVDEPEQSQGPSAEKGATILLVEDEYRVRILAGEVLREAGYTVIEASNGRKALDVAESSSHPPALVLTDLVMPEMSGLELAEQLRKKWPELPIIYTSGYTDHALLARSALRQDTPFLQKPYTLASLLEQVASELKRGNRDTVLIVDDDANIRQLLRATFEDAGYRVLEAQDGRGALDKVARHSVKLVVTDLVMPEKDGVETIRALRQTHPDVKILAISGAVGGSYLKIAGHLGADAVVPKPFRREQVLEAVEQLL